jgi:hypothetical protein
MQHVRIKEQTMHTFSLKAGTDTFVLDTEGAVFSDGSHFGNWKTTSENRVLLTPTLGEEFPIEVEWLFNDDNQLCLLQDGHIVFNFFTSSDHPRLFTRNAVLHVRPARAKPFEFELRGEWNMTESHDLEFVIDGRKSVIHGYVESLESRFNYFFFDRSNPLKGGTLGFVGKWDVAADADGIPRMSFTYSREDGSTDVFSLPEAATIDTAINQFVYQYEKAGQAHRVVLVGRLRINPDFTISYAIDRQQSGSGAETVSATSFTLEAAFGNSSFQGNLALVLKKTDGSAGAHSLVIGGNFTGVLGASQLQVGFNYIQVHDGQQLQETFGFNGNLALGGGGKVFWNFNVSSTVTTIELGASDITLGSAKADARLNLTAQDGTVVGVSIMFGIAF